MKLRRHNHYVPACYQKGFSDTSGRVWVKFADSLAPEHRNPKSVGRQHDLYIITENGIETDRVETFFDAKVENDFGVLSRKIKQDPQRFSISRNDVGVLAKFVASQTVRTIGHKETIEEQAKREVDTNTFVQVMSRKMLTMLEQWVNAPPDFHFYTSLPHVGDHFITGDQPVVVIIVNDNPIWMPVDIPKMGITDLSLILQNPKHAFRVSLSPYVLVSIQGSGGIVHKQESVDPLYVRHFNSLVRDQCKIFTLAKDKESLQ